MLEATTLRVQTVTLCTESRQVSEFCVAGASVGKRCPLMHSTTKGRGAASEEDCVCRAGYFKGGGSCEPARPPLGSEWVRGVGRPVLRPFVSTS